MNIQKLGISLLFPLIIGISSAILTRDAMQTFEQISKPPLSPPGILFPIVWTILYLLMGLSFYLVWSSGGLTKRALFFYSAQLFFNFFWSIWFFGQGWYLFSFVWLLILWILILGTILSFYKINRIAAWLLLPYLLWVAFAGYLNFSIYLLNP